MNDNEQNAMSGDFEFIDPSESVSIITITADGKIYVHGKPVGHDDPELVAAFKEWVTDWKKYHPPSAQIIDENSQSTALTINNKIRNGETVIIRKSRLPIYMSDCNKLKPQDKVDCEFKYHENMVHLVPLS